MAVSTIDALYNGTSEKLTTSATGITVTGTVAATAYTGDGSALTGVGSPSIDDNGDATAMTITSDEKIGIGTSSPDLKLDVSHGTTSQYVATFQNTADNLELKVGTTTGGSLNIQGATVNNNTPYEIGLNTEGGNVGIGISSPSSWAKLDILGTGGSQTGATQALHVRSPSATAGEGVGIRLNAASGSHEAVGIIGMVNNASGNAGSMTFHTYDGGATIPERMRIDSSGRVTKPYQPYFNVQKSSSQNNITAGAYTTVTFGTEHVDTGGNFANNTFTAPVTGVYSLSIGVRLDNVDTSASYYNFWLQTSNRAYHQLRDVKFTQDSIFIFAMNVIADMDANDTAVLQIQQQGGATQTDINPSTFFQGYLLG